MSRVEENKNLLNSLRPFGEEVFTLAEPNLEANTLELFQKALLVDISKSLAVIADTFVEMNKKEVC